MAHMNNKPKTLDESIRELIEAYHELNANVVDEVFEEPSALEFMRCVARNRPFIVRGGAQSWKAVQGWSADYLIDAIGDNEVNVSITPHGDADSVFQNEDGSLFFIKPYERDETFRDLITYIQDQEKSSSKQRPVKYGQTQNDNLRNEYSDLFSDVPTYGPPFARIALGRHPEAINFWLGNSLSTTSMHKDNYENIYAQIRGQKHFVLLPPIAAPAVNENAIRAASYILRNDYAKGQGGEIGMSDLEARFDEPKEDIQWALWDPDIPDERATAYSKLVKPLKVTLNEGDILYLPALWYHKVSQSCGEEGFCCAVNYWYDMDFTGSFWAANTFICDAAKVEAEMVRGPHQFQTNLYQ
ncbi:phospholipase A2 [Delphinella strobiligena]|nr:phospholipase A2 [Delphinella strobiligena]